MPGSILTLLGVRRDSPISDKSCTVALLHSSFVRSEPVTMFNFFIHFFRNESFVSHLQYSDCLQDRQPGRIEANHLYSILGFFERVSSMESSSATLVRSTKYESLFSTVRGIMKASPKVCILQRGSDDLGSGIRGVMVRFLPRAKMNGESVFLSLTRLLTGL